MPRVLSPFLIPSPFQPQGRAMSTSSPSLPGGNPTPSTITPRVLAPGCHQQRDRRECHHQPHPVPPLPPRSCPGAGVTQMNGPCHRPVLPRGDVTVIYGAGGGGDRQPQPQAPAAPLVPGVSSGDTGPVPAGAVGTVGAASSSLGVLGAEIPTWRGNKSHFWGS